MTLILRNENTFYTLVRIGLYLWGFGEKLVYFRDLGEQRQSTFMEPRQLFSGSWEDQRIIFSDQGSTDPSGGLNCLKELSLNFKLFLIEQIAGENG